MPLSPSLHVHHVLQVDVDAVDFGLVAFGFRYAKEFTLNNICAIPMQYAWRVPKDSLDPAHKEFTVLLAAPVVMHVRIPHDILS